jgi:probable rRNA maturation factor
VKKTKILIDEKGHKIKGYRSFTRRIAAKILRSLSIENPTELSILLVDDETMLQMNSRFRKVNATTDVLAFPMKEGFEMTPVPDESIPMPLGDIVISVETAQAQASAYSHSIEEEIALLTTHGILHLLGYDDETTQQRTIMEKKAAEVLKASEIRSFMDSLDKNRHP